MFYEKKENIKDSCGVVYNEMKKNVKDNCLKKGHPNLSLYCWYIENISEVPLSLQKSLCIPTCIILPVQSFQPLPTKEIHQGQH